MRGNTHAYGGALAGAAYALTAGLPATAAVTAVGAGILGGLLPDIDHAHSKISGKAGILGSIIRLFTTHRGVLHTPLFWGILTAALLMLSPIPKTTVIPVFLGILSHLALDTLNPTGIMWAWPLCSKKLHITKIKTGSMGERVVMVFLLLALAVVLIPQYGLTIGYLMGK